MNALALIAIAVTFIAFTALAWRLRPHTLIAVDTSASTGWGTQWAPITIDDIRRRLPRWTLRRYSWVTFNQTVAPYTPGEPLTSNLGTDFGALTAWVENPDNGTYTDVIVVTDGHAPDVHPHEPEKWTWWLTHELPKNLTLTGMRHEVITTA